MVYGNEQIGDNGSQARSRTEQAEQWARARGTQATDWARSQLSDFQGRVESDPQRAILWALGVGLIAGLVLSGLLRSSREART